MASSKLWNDVAITDYKQPHNALLGALRISLLMRNDKII